MRENIINILSHNLNMKKEIENLMEEQHELIDKFCIEIIKIVESKKKISLIAR